MRWSCFIRNSTGPNDELRIRLGIQFQHPWLRFVGDDLARCPHQLCQQCRVDPDVGTDIENGIARFHDGFDESDFTRFELHTTIKEDALLIEVP